MNPYNSQADFVTEIIYKQAHRAIYPDPIPLIQNWIYQDIPNFISKFAARHNRVIPAIVAALYKDIFPDTDVPMEGTLGELFWDTTQVSAAFGCGFGIDHTDFPRAAELFINLMNTKGPIPGILSARFVRKSQATLAFTKFEITCILEVDGIPWEPNENMISLNDFLAEVITAFKEADIPFTLHWGKNAPWDYAGLITTMYGTAGNKWMNIRSALLRPEMATLFSNSFLKTVGLNGFNTALPPEFATLRTSIVNSV